MISKELQEHCEERFNSERCNTNIIFVEGYYREAAFQEAFPQFVKLSHNAYRDMTSGTEWKFVKVSPEGCRGRRVKRAIVDTRISEEIFREQILPTCACYCIRMDFFD